MIRKKIRTGILCGISMGLLTVSVCGQTTRNMSVLGQFNPTPTQKYGSVWGFHGTDGKEYALLTVQGQRGGQGGTHVVDISNPAKPVSRGFINSPTGLWHELKTWKQILYKCSDQGAAGMQIIDLAPVSNGQPPKELKAYTGGSPAVGRCHNLWLDTTRTPALLYLVQPSRTRGVIIASLADPLNPVEIGRLPTEAHDFYARGNRLYVSTGDTHSWDIYDVTDPAKPQRITRTLFNPTNQILGEPMKNSSGNPRLYSHNVWLTDDGKHAYTTEETVGTSVKAWDISDETKPIFLDSYVSSKNVIPHNVLINGNFMQVAHYGQGLRIIDITNPAKMVEVAFHKPSSTREVFGGSWGAYGWFKSGNYIHGDGDMGLFIVRMTDAGTSVDFSDNQWISPFSVTGLGRQEVLFTLPHSGAYSLSISDLAGKRLFVTHRTGEAGSQRLLLERPFTTGKYIVSLHQSGMRATSMDRKKQDW